jgi:hypothetical protein
VEGYGSGDSGLLASVLDNVVSARPVADSGNGPGQTGILGNTGTIKPFGGGPVGGGPSGPTNWTSLLGQGKDNSGQRTGGPAANPIGRVRPRGPRNPGGLDGPNPGLDIPAQPNRPLASNVPITQEGQHTRTDFVILFVWKEPTPSDLLRQIGAKK